jgi:hypothetical protein
LRGVDDIEEDAGCFVGRLAARANRSAVEVPAGFGELLDELDFSSGGGFVFVMEIACSAAGKRRDLRRARRGGGW